MSEGYDPGCAVLSVHNLTKSFQGVDGPVPVLRGVSLNLGPGETLALTGESGSGKSTLLHLIGGLEQADSGTIDIDGTRLTGLSDRGRATLRRGTVGVIFQQFNLIPSLTVAENIAFQARLAGRYDRGVTADLADKLGLTAQLRKYPEQLSGGQQQRVAIARTLAARPRLVLADEPTGNLDEDTALRVLETLCDLAKETRSGLLMVTHSVQLASKLDRRLHLRSGVIT